MDGGEYGLDVIWDIVRRCSDELKSGGFLVMETNLGHPEYLETHFQDQDGPLHNMIFYEAREDFSYRKRFVILQKVAKETRGEGWVKNSNNQLVVEGLVI